MKKKDLTAERFKELRTRLGLTQRGLVEELGLASGYSLISKYENGRIKPGIETCLKYIEIAEKNKINIDISYLRPDLYKNKVKK
jgi:transcriptional regulator with XRE-family HTH domain